MLTIHPIYENNAEAGIVKDLFQEYLAELNENLHFQSFDEELENPLKKYGPPEGLLFLAYWGDIPAGCIALQLLNDQTCEMKRLYVRAQFRGEGIGDELIKFLLNGAVELGYKKVVLDTLERLQSAIRLYEKHGFIKTSAYYRNPLSNVVYMQKDL